MVNEKIIARREDGFFITYANWSDFPKLKKLANNLSEENKKFYQPWMFKNNPSIKIRIAQFLARISLIPLIGKLLKNLYPFGFAVIIKCLSEKNEIVGMHSIYNFRRLDDHTFMAVHADMIKEEYQKMGLGSFQLKCMHQIAKKENVSKSWATVHVKNQKSLSHFLKNGWKIIKIQKNFIDSNNEKYDLAEISKDL